MVFEAEAFKQAEQIRGEGDAIAAQNLSDAYSKTRISIPSRSLKAYEETFAGKDDR